jgi:multisubunit Na+/H+ antiporter MnhB subunit
MTLVFDLILCLMIIGTAAAALLMRNALAAIVFFIVFGNLLGLAWLAMDAVNVAMAEIAIGAGVTGVLLILARQRLMALGDDLVCAATPGWLHAGALVVCAGFTALAGSAVLSVAPADDLGGPIAALMPGLGIENPVTGVLLAFRAYDTLLETFVLLGALVAIWSLAPAIAWPHPPASLALAENGGQGVAAAYGRLLLPLALVMAAYLVYAGSDQPGGAFQAGTVLAGGLIVAAIGGAVSWPRADSGLIRAVLVLGPAVFLIVGLSGIALGRFLSYPPGFEKALIVAIEYSLALSIGATLALQVAGPPAAPDHRG